MTDQSSSSRSRIRPSGIATALGIGAVTLLGFPAHGQSKGDVQDLFRKEYPAASKKLEEFYKRICLKFTNVPGNGSEEGRYTGEYRSNGRSMRLDLHYPGRGDASWVTSPERHFAVQRVGPQPYSLSRMGAVTPGDAVRTIQVKAEMPFAVYSIFDQPIASFVEEPAFKITKAEYVDNPGGELVKVEWESPIPGGGEGRTPQTRVGWFLFDPQHAWALRESAFAYDKRATGRIHCAVQYDGEKNGIPIVKSAEYFSENAGKKFPRKSVTVDEVSLTPARSSDFELAVFGIPDEVGQGSGWPVWLLAIGLVGLAVSLAIAVAIRRRSA